MLDSSLWTLGSLSAHIYLVERDVRAVAELTVHNNHIAEVLGEIKKSGLRYILNSYCETHTSIHIYKHPHLKHIINYSIEADYDISVFKRWVNGKLYGYSEAAIAKWKESIDPDSLIHDLE